MYLYLFQNQTELWNRIMISMVNENRPEGLISEIKASENSALELVEKAGKISKERLSNIEKRYEEKSRNLKARFKQDKINTVQKALHHAAEQEVQRKKDIDKIIHCLEQGVREKKDEALKLIMEKIMG